MGLGVDEDIDDEDRVQASQSYAESFESASDSESSAGGVSDDEDEVARIEDAVNANTRHAPVKVPRVQSPFTEPDTEADFITALNNAREDDAIPSGFGLLVNEDGFGQWETSEYIKVGRVRHLKAILPESVWQPRVVQWVQALAGLEAFLAA